MTKVIAYYDVSHESFCFPSEDEDGDDDGCGCGAIQRALANTQPLGTFACPICGFDRPHHHSDEQVAAYRSAKP